MSGWRAIPKRASTLGLVLGSIVACSASEDAKSDPAGCGDTKELVLHCDGDCSGGNAQSRALAVIEAQFKAKCPNVNFVKQSALSQVTAQEQLKEKLARNEPPDIFYSDAGRSLTEFAGASDAEAQIEPLEFLYDANGWNQSFQPEMIAQVSVRDRKYGIPIGFNRENTLYYSKQIFDENKLTPPKTWDEFFVIAEALKAKGIPAISVAQAERDVWTTAILFQSIFLATAGRDYYVDFYAGKKDPADGQYRKAVDLFLKVLGYQTKDAVTLAYLDSVKAVATGKAAMMVQGTWATSNLATAGLKPGVDYGMTAAPQTDGLFVAAGTGYVLARGARNRQNATAFLSILGSKAGAEAFASNTKWLAARLDVSTDAVGYDAPTKAMYDELKTAHILRNMPAQTPARFLDVSDQSIADLARKKDAPGSADVAVQAIANVYHLLKSSP